MADIFIRGQVGRLEARYLPPRTKNHPVVVVLHPSQLQGGRMNNDVINTICLAFHRHGFGTLRFNFRGVGRSEGSYSGGDGELNDAATVVDWLQSSQRVAHRLWISGFSFGALIAMQILMRRPEIEGFVIVSPPVSLYDFGFLAPCPVSGQLLYGSRDAIVPRESVDNLVMKLNGQKGILIDYQVIDGADHSFNGRLADVQNVISAYVSTLSHRYVGRDTTLKVG
ncbi:MAG: alpha/beta hydrolase [Bacteroidales bacterium]|jgi:alpha/beta superfamily hydrolase|nr:alpha/beta hydrolase [Bacteroidales bacterium]